MRTHIASVMPIRRTARSMPAVLTDVPGLAQALETRRARPQRLGPGPSIELRRRPTLPHGDRAVPSAQEGLTAVFGMGTGVAPPLSPPEIEIWWVESVDGEQTRGSSPQAKNSGQAARPFSTG